MRGIYRKKKWYQAAKGKKAGTNSIAGGMNR
jgi:hypothetical protein